MSNIPMRAAQFKTAEFLAWLSANGAEVGGATNPYEVVRYKAYTSDATKALTHIVYRKENGLLTWTGAAMKHYQAFLDGEPFKWSQPFRAITSEPKPEPVKKLGTAARYRAKLLERDGGDCWFCGTAMGSDCTLEHLVPSSKGGGTSLANLALAHSRCNERAADLSISEKVLLRQNMRADA